jgi:hypothetical protein
MKGFMKLVAALALVVCFLLVMSIVPDMTTWNPAITGAVGVGLFVSAVILGRVRAKRGVPSRDA